MTEENTELQEYHDLVASVVINHWRLMIDCLDALVMQSAKNANNHAALDSAQAFVQHITCALPRVSAQTRADQVHLKEMIEDFKKAVNIINESSNWNPPNERINLVEFNIDDSFPDEIDVTWSINYLVGRIEVNSKSHIGSSFQVVVHARGQRVYLISWKEFETKHYMIQPTDFTFYEPGQTHAIIEVLAPSRIMRTQLY